MALLAATPTPHTGFQKEFSWDSSRAPAYAPPTNHKPNNSVSLPSIHHAIPELREAVQPPRSVDTSPSAAAGPSTSPAYVHSPVSNKRRRDSVDDEQEARRLRQVPRLYHGQDESAHRQPSPRSRHPDAWTRPAGTSPHPRAVPVEVIESIELRHNVPTFPPSMGADRNSAPRPPTREHRVEEYRDHCQPAPVSYPPRPVVDTAPRYAAPHYEQQFHHKHAHPSSPPHHTYERTPFSAGPYARQYGEYSRYGDLAHGGNDNKQRKRRGNLPKETTDKLRAWFMAHLSHPYPTEDEKQELMRQTNLQMNQISNWFINARRRQLPTMISNARVASDAMSGRSADGGKILPSTERQDTYSHTQSDGEGGGYDDDFDSLKHGRATAMKRGSV